MTTRWGFSGPDASPAPSPRTCGWSRAPSSPRSAPARTHEPRRSREEHGFAAAYGSYEELLADESVDAVYVASPHALHVEHVTAALEAGKHVLCEKPMTLRAADAEEMFALARAHGAAADGGDVDRLPPGRPGGPRTASGRARSAPRATCTPSSASSSTPPPDDRLLDPALGAGALLDMGIYPLTFAHLLLGEAEELTATAALSDTGFDLDIAIAGRYPGGAVATMIASMTSWSSRRA